MEKPQVQKPKLTMTHPRGYRHVSQRLHVLLFVNPSGYKFRGEVRNRPGSTWARGGQVLHKAQQPRADLCGVFKHRKKPHAPGEMVTVAPETRTTGAD